MTMPTLFIISLHGFDNGIGLSVCNNFALWSGVGLLTDSVGQTLLYKICCLMILMCKYTYWLHGKFFLACIYGELKTSKKLTIMQDLFVFKT